MRFIAAICLFFLSTFSVWANEVLVSVGQQADATRLILTFEDRPDWEIELSDQTVAIDFLVDNNSIDVSFDNRFLKGTRIKKISLNRGSSSLLIELSCDCSAEIYPHGSESLIVEIRDGFGDPQVEQVARIAPDQPVLELLNRSSGPLSQTFDLPVPAGPSQQLASVVVEANRTENQEIRPAQVGVGLDLIETLSFSMRTTDENQAIEYLSQELSRAASQGLIEPGTDPTQIRPQEMAKGSSASLANRSNFSVTTSLDRDIRARRDRTSPTDQGAVCFSDSDVDLTTWGDSTDFSVLGDLRRDIIAEDGTIEPAGAQALARYYVVLGFGAEASGAANFMADGRSKELLQALAQIVDHGFSRSSVLDGQIYCDGKVALWAALARPIGADGPPISTKSILATFSALPPHQRAHLGPVLAERLREAGLENDARNAVNAVARGGLQSNESELVTARLELEGTKHETARETLASISDGTDVTAAGALLELLEDAVRRGMAPNPQWVEDAPSLARATEGTDVAAELNIAGLYGRIALGQFDQLRAALPDNTPGLNSEVRGELAIAGLVEAVSNASDVEFLRAEMGLSKMLDLLDISREGRFSIAQRLLDIGLADRAEKYLTPDPTSTSELETVADVLMETGQMERAIALLEMRDEEHSARKLGAILNAIGQTEGALEAYVRGGALDDAASVAIRSGNWAWIAEREIKGESGSVSDAARQLLASPVASTDPNKPENGPLIQTSQEIRKQAAALLSATPISDVTLSR